MKLISPDAIAAMERGDAIVSGAVSIACDPPVRAWGGYGTLTIDGQPFVGVGDRGMAQITGGALGGDEQNVTLTLSGIEPELIALLDAAELMGAAAVVYRLIFDGSGTQLLDCRAYKRGRADQAPVEEVIGGTASIRVEVESAARGLGRNGGRMRSDADQRLIDSEDGFFKHVTYAGVKQIYFGGKKSSASGATVTGGAAPGGSVDIGNLPF